MSPLSAPDSRHSRPRPRGRPRTAPDLSETRQRLIRTGLIHLTEKGYGATGIDEILKASGVPKGSFYHHFPSKAAFGAALIEAYHAYFVARLDRALSDDSLPPVERLRAFTRDAEAGMARHGFRRGCLIGNLGQETAALPEDFRAALIDVLTDWQARTARCLSAAPLPAGTDPDALAALFWTGWEGAVLRAKLEGGPAPLRLFAGTFFTLISPSPKEEPACSTRS
ncbi:TetR family transcriptional regulator [Pararhodobacter marinus]|uniref:TetR family transcriptional regulator n=1 Tax=Pararhodobacter marinus TaxID=2184063 RepID=A0A2U2C8N8_9RHOB|nr:TetR/AcrR family transcriptional regulator [Pararhodobacter marinus]PWE28240.1 TetR family transcriptional regulator [Pararhodobacter marinus]